MDPSMATPGLPGIEATSAARSIRSPDRSHRTPGEAEI